MKIRQAQLQWRLKKAHRTKPIDRVWRNHSLIDAREADQRVRDHNDHDEHFEYRHVKKETQ